MTPITLSTASDQATFDELLAQPTTTLVIIFGADAAATAGQDFCQGLENDSPGDYVSVQFVFVPDSSIILNSLQQLQINIPPAPSKNFAWSDYPDTSCLSISPGTNIISFDISNDDLLNHAGFIRAAIICAYHNQ